MQTKEAKMKRWGLFFVMLLSVSLILLPGVSAAEEASTGRIVQHVQKTEMIEVGDVPGHTMGVSINTGLIFYSTGVMKGEIATTRSANIFDLVIGKGTITGKREITYKDGSFRFVNFTGTVTPVEGGKGSITEGTYECTGGTGKFAGWKGTGTFKGTRIGTGGDSYVDFTDNCKKQ
jgi:hypothetical protein